MKVQAGQRMANGEWAFVGESVRQPGQLALGTLAGGGAGSQDDLEERPLIVALLANHLCQQPTTLCAARTGPTQATRRSSSPGVVIPCQPQQRRSVRIWTQALPVFRSGFPGHLLERFCLLQPRGGGARERVACPQSSAMEMPWGAVGMKGRSSSLTSGMNLLPSLLKG